MRLTSDRERAERAAETLARFITHGVHGYKKRPVYGVFNGDVMLHWSLSKATAQQAANRSWIELRVQHIGSI